MWHTLWAEPLDHIIEMAMESNFKKGIELTNFIQDLCKYYYKEKVDTFYLWSASR